MNILFCYYFLLGTEFKSVACNITGCMMYLDMQHRKEGMKEGKCLNTEMGTTASCSVRVMESFTEATGIKGDVWL